jgi:hypothetical protein
MADYPESSIAKRYDLGAITASTTNSTLVAGSTAVNLAKQALPIQGGLLGNFGGATVVGTVTTAITGASGTVEIALQGSHDNVTFFNLLPIAPATVMNTFQVGATIGGRPSGALAQVTSANFAGPLPQYIRGALLSGSTAPTAGAVTLNVIVHG